MISLLPVEVALDIAGGNGVAGALALALVVGPTSRLLDNQPEAVRAAAVEFMRAAIEPFAKGDTVPMGASIWIVTARNP